MRELRKFKIPVVATVLVVTIFLVGYFSTNGNGLISQTPQEDQSNASVWPSDVMVKNTAQQEEETLILADKSDEFMHAVGAVINGHTDQGEYDFSVHFSEGAIERNFKDGVVDREALQAFLNWDDGLDSYKLEEASFSSNPNTGEKNALAGVRTQLIHGEHQSTSILLWEKQGNVWKIEGVMNMGH